MLRERFVIKLNYRFEVYQIDRRITKFEVWDVDRKNNYVDLVMLPDTLYRLHMAMRDILFFGIQSKCALMVYSTDESRYEVEFCFADNEYMSPPDDDPEHLMFSIYVGKVNSTSRELVLKTEMSHQDLFDIDRALEIIVEDMIKCGDLQAQ